MSCATLTPAYGRDYRSKFDAIKDFDAAKDFILSTPWGGGLINKPQLIDEGYTSVKLRYNKLRSAILIPIKREGD